ncbi:MAG: hypothetical protein IKR81_02180, partial [Victivallales bacterium]|nr:hypothetical protein [Victivallales bacterium]
VFIGPQPPPPQDETRAEAGKTIIKLTGSAAEPSSDLQPGWNLVSPQNLPKNASAFMLDSTTNSYIRYTDTNRADAACWVFEK